MKDVGHGTAWGIARRLWVAIGLTLAAGCSSGVSDDPAGNENGGNGGSGGFGGRQNTEMVDQSEIAVPDSLDQTSVIAAPVMATACTADNQCATGYCSDGFCCDQRCDNKCMACSVAKKGGGVDGVCGSIAYDTDPDNDCPYGACDGKNVCKNYNGVACTATSQCLSNYCVDGFCCNITCMGSCQACSAVKKGSGYDGVCGSIKAATDPDNECNPGECNGSGACNSLPQPTSANGAKCNSSTQCASGYCTDGVCCDSSCTSTCMACTAVLKGGGSDGTCGPIPNDKDPDEECWGGACNGAGVCKQYNGVPCLNKSQCLSNYCIDGVCCNLTCDQLCYACSAGKKGQGYDGVCGPIASGRDIESECNPGECNGAGACNQPQNPQANGTVCVSGGQCASGYCIDGVCCNTACNGTCVACTAAKKGSGADGTCGNIGSELDPDVECNGGKCDGKGVCRYYNGGPCTSTGQCFSNYCVDGFCCNLTCNGACQACSNAKKGSGYDGVCGNIANATDPDNECNPGECNGGGACNQPQSQQANGAACTLATQCLSSNCVDGVCCDTACVGNCVACTAAKKGQGTNGTCGYIITNTDPDNECANSDCNGSGGCTNPTNIPNGGSCGNNGQCASGNCVDGVCCDTACSGICQACTALKKGQGTDGTCGPIKYDTDPDEECYGGGCTGTGACGFYNGVACTAKAQCLSTYCVDGVCCNNDCGGTCYACSATKKGSGYDGVCSFIKTNTDPDNECVGVCNGSGACVNPTCSTNADCGANASCSNTACVCNSGYAGDGFNCTDVDECQTNNGFCDINAICTNTPGSRTCACKPGYSGDGLTCVLGGQVADIRVGGKFTCVRSTAGRVKCWGENTWGQLGLGDSVTRGDNAGEMGSNLPVINLGTGRTATAIAVGGAHACAILDNGQLKCWGNNSTGQLGLGVTGASVGSSPSDMGDSLPAVNLGTGKTAMAIAAYGGNTCAILNDGSLKCWGDNIFGQLGLGDTVQRGDHATDMGDNLATINLGTGKTAVAVSIGYSQVCALLNDASVKCWGHNDQGQLGLGDTADRGDNPNEMGDNLPVVNLGTGKTALAINVGISFACAQLNDNTVKCWGYNGQGQLGQGDTTSRGITATDMGDNLLPINLGTGKTATKIVAGRYSGNRACAVLNDNTLKCWGDNFSGTLGLGDLNNRGDNANEMGDNLPAINLGAGIQSSNVSVNIHTCAILSNSFVKCWGQNDSGQLGLGDTVLRGATASSMGDNLPLVSIF